MATVTKPGGIIAGIKADNLNDEFYVNPYYTIVIDEVTYDSDTPAGGTITCHRIIYLNYIDPETGNNVSNKIADDDDFELMGGLS